jgi:hypothetical protein
MSVCFLILSSSFISVSSMNIAHPNYVLGHFHVNRRAAPSNYNPPIVMANQQENNNLNVVCNEKKRGGLKWYL